ncbi:hypothetical protein GGR51DRAFT_535828 [Nemania sp. FL0031]|nr:hypothetical protein GGR51DRAFT_535828 [Nemania sp. FL0031]
MLYSDAATLLIALVATCEVVYAQTYSSVTTVKQFISQLNLNSSQHKSIGDILGSTELTSNLPVLGELTISALPCLVSRVVFGASYLDSSSPGYQDRVNVNWSGACWKDAKCIVRPSTATEVAKAMLIITFLGANFAIRSGGHNPNPGFGSIGESGILIDMVNMNEITLASDGSVASVGPGNRFGAVFAKLNELNRTLVGGRIEDVGVGGYYLGGGMAFFSSMYGLAADSIQNFQVVLSDSSIVNANATSNADLFWALKGGGSNFGVVTRYDIKTIPVEEIWFEALLYDPSQSEKLFQAVVEYATVAESDTAAGLVFNLTPDAGLVGFIYNKPIVRPAVYQPFYNITPSGVYVNSKVGTWLDLANAFADTTPLHDESRFMIVSIAHEWSLPVLQDSYATYLNLSAQVAREFNATLAYGVQPYSSAAVRHSSTAGGNPLGLKPVAQNWFTSTIQYAEAADDERAINAIQALGRAVASASRKYGVDLPLHFMNDANYKQNVFAGYGSVNVQRLRRISRQYDPFQVFQNLQNDGFLLSKA